MKIGHYTLAASILLIIAFCSASASFAASKPVEKKPYMVIGNISLGEEAKKAFDFAKIEAAVYFTNRLTGKYHYIDLRARDSVSQEVLDSNPNATSQDILNAINPDVVYFIHANVLANMLRISMTKYDVKSKTSTDGIGYSLAHYVRVTDAKPLYDPAIFEATERAVAVCEADSGLFNRRTGVDSVFNLVPVPTLVISGIQMNEDSVSTKWNLFEDPEVTSYFMIESMFDTLKANRDFAVYDTESRDSIYALFNLKIPENQRAINPLELACLAKVEVDYAVSGHFLHHSDSTGVLELLLLKLNEKSAESVSKETVIINEDSREKLGEAVKSAVIKLLKKKEK